MFKLLSFIGLLIVIVNCNAAIKSKPETPGFFLKMTKNIPRLGRRSHSLDDYEHHFLKTSKSIPRIGRSGDPIETNEIPLTTSARRYNTIQPYDSSSLHQLVVNQEVDEGSIKFIPWDALDFALDNDNGLFEKLISLADDELTGPLLAAHAANYRYDSLAGDTPEGQKYYYRYK